MAIIEITQTELAAKAISTNREELIFENQVFTRGPSFSLRYKEPALKYCQQMAKHNLKSLLIQEKYGFTIWTQSHKPENQRLNMAILKLVKYTSAVSYPLRLAPSR